MTGSAKKPPKEAEAISLTKLSKTNRQVEFIWRGEATSLQQWLAAVTGLVDLEVSEVGAETAFLGMYEDEPEAKP